MVELINNIKWLGSSKLLVKIINAVLGVYLARALGPNNYGVFALFLTIASTILMFSNFGVPGATAKFIANSQNNKEKNGYLYNGFIFILTFILIFITVLHIFHKQIFDLINSSSLNNYIYIIYFYIFSQSLIKYLAKIYQGDRRVYVSGKINLYVGWTPILLSSILVFLKFETTGAILGKAIGSIIILIFYFIYLKKDIVFNLKFIKPNFKVIKKIVSYAIPMFLSSMSFFVYMKSDSLMVQYFLGSESLAYYDVVFKIISLLHLPGVIIGSAASSYIAMDEIKKNVFKNVMEILLLIYFPIVLGLFIISEDAIIFLFGSEYLSAVPVMKIYCLYTFLYGLAAFFSLSMDYYGLAKIRAKVVGFSAIINVLLNLYMIPKYGLIGAAISTQLTYTPYIIIELYILIKNIDLNIKLLINKVFYILIAGTIMFLTLFQLQLNWVLIIALGIIIYSSLIILFIKSYRRKDFIIYFKNLLNFKLEN